ncbi:MAG: hypothetical protein ACREMJ_02850, partial [Gemmatimonadales bacterium]
MIAQVVAVLLGAPDAVVIATPQDETRVPVVRERGPALAAPLLERPLGLTLTREGTGTTVRLGGATFHFQLGVPYVRTGSAVYSLVAAPYALRDTVFLPLQWLAEHVPRVLDERYRWDGAAGRLVELR